MARRGAGRFRDPATFQVRAGVGDAFGNPDTAWQDYETRRVELLERTSGESLEGGVLQSHTQARLKVRKDARMLMLPTDGRVKVRGRTWSIVSIADLNGTTVEDRNVLEIVVDSGVST